MNNAQIVELARKVVYGIGAIKKLATLCKDLEYTKVLIVSGPTVTKGIVKDYIYEQFEKEQITYAHEVVRDDNLEELKEYTKSYADIDSIVAVGGGHTIDISKVLASWMNVSYITVPTNASHDGFTSPYVNFLLRRELSNHKDEYPPYRPQSPIGIIGDTELIAQSPKKYIAAGVGDTVAKFVAELDWSLAHRMIGEEYDIYAASFGLMTAKMVADKINDVAQGNELGIRALFKAHGSSGVAMSIAGSSRPASGSEHLISHSLDLLSLEHDYDNPHGFQTGIGTIIGYYLHGKDWKYIKQILQKVGAPTTLDELRIDRDIMIEAMLMAPKIRKRYTILSCGLTKKAAIKALEQTEID